MKAKLTPFKGIAPDPTQAQLGPEYWTDCENMRFRNGRAEPFDGTNYPGNQPTGGINGNIVYSLIGTNADQDLVNQGGMPDDILIAVGSDSVEATSSALFIDVTPAVWNVTSPQPIANEIHTAVLNGIPYLSATPYAGIHYWDRDQANNFVELPGWATQLGLSRVTGDIVASKYHLFALGLVSTAGTNADNPSRVQWSAATEQGALPDFEILPSNDAGFVDLGDTEGPLVGGELVGDQVYIAKHRSLYTAQYIGGQSVWNFRLRHRDIGTLNKRTMASVDGRLFLMTQSDIGFTDGNQFVSVATDRVRDAIYDNMREPDACFVVHYPTKSEIWCWCSIDYLVPDVAFVYNYQQDTWGKFYSFPTNCGLFAGAPYDYGGGAGKPYHFVGAQPAHYAPIITGNGDYGQVDFREQFSAGVFPSSHAQFILDRSEIELGEDPQRTDFVDQLVFRGDADDPANFVNIYGGMKMKQTDPDPTAFIGQARMGDTNAIKVAEFGRLLRLEMQSQDRYIVDGMLINYTPGGQW